MDRHTIEPGKRSGKCHNEYGYFEPGLANDIYL
jgi:hypothetical protein